MPVEDSYGLLAPLYLMEEKRLYLFSHHTEGLVWQVIDKTTFKEHLKTFLRFKETRRKKSAGVPLPLHIATSRIVEDSSLPRVQGDLLAGLQQHPRQWSSAVS